MTTINPTIFRAYDIRGVVGQELSEAVYFVLRLAHCLGGVAAKKSS